MNVREKELVNLRKRLDEYNFNNYYGLPIVSDVEVAEWIQRYEQIAQDLGEDAYQAPQMHWE